MLKILIVRRDNIGDLICTLPLIKSLRILLPHAQIDLLVNSYAAPIVDNNTDINNLYVYTKAKHRRKDQNIISVYLERIFLTLKMRMNNYDWLILANVGYNPRPLRWAWQINAKRVVGFIEDAKNIELKITNPVVLDKSSQKHEVEYIMQLLEPFGTVDVIPRMGLLPDPKAIPRARFVLGGRDKSNRPLIGINISARLPDQQWSAGNFVELIRAIGIKFQCALFWAPGSQSSTTHPGDNEKAHQIIEECKGVGLIPYPTEALEDLVAGIHETDLFITADGGALHIGAACGKPVLALFGSSNETQWYPWGVRHQVIKSNSCNVKDITQEEVLDAFHKLVSQI